HRGDRPRHKRRAARAWSAARRAGCTARDRRARGRAARGCRRRRRRRGGGWRGGGSAGAVANVSPAGAPIITFLADYGLRDEFVGACHGVIARRCPQARVIDVTHGIPRHDVRAGAIVLAGSLAYMPAGVHLAVVDPGVGASGAHARRALALRAATEARLLVGPDNGLLMLAAERLGGAAEAIEISGSRARLEPVSQTFHGRDIFAPVAAALAAGEQLGSLGTPLAVDELVRLQLPSARLRDGALLAHVL